MFVIYISKLKCLVISQSLGHTIWLIFPKLEVSVEYRILVAEERTLHVNWFQRIHDTSLCKQLSYSIWWPTEINRAVIIKPVKSIWNLYCKYLKKSRYTNLRLITHWTLIWDRIMGGLKYWFSTLLFKPICVRNEPFKC